MKRLVLFVLLAATLPLPLLAARRQTVAQLEKALTVDIAARRPDSEIARHIAASELTERLTAPTFVRLNSQLPADNQESQAALKLVFERAEFLNPPLSELPTTPAPEPEAQQKLLAAARAYVSQTLPRLPNFLATRVINLYDDSPQVLKKGDWPVRAGLHLVGTSTGQISVQQERENQPAAQSSAVWESKIGLASGGEFGTTLAMILTDAEKGDVKWSHWERTVDGSTAAVLRYSVPASASHYEVIGSIQRGTALEGVRSRGGGVSGIDARPSVSAANHVIVRSRPAYHGEIWIDPATGAILRITMEADSIKDVLQRAAILVEYGPVEIGGQTFLCPLRGLAFSEAVPNPAALESSAPTQWMNETAFVGYHRFGSSSRIVTESAEGPGPASAPEAKPVATPQAAASPPVEPSPTSVVSAQLNASPNSAAAEPAPAPETVPREPAPASPGAKVDLLNQPQISIQTDGTPTLRVQVNSLLVPVVVRDRKGLPIAGIGKDEFRITDDGKSQAISGFTVVNAPAQSRSDASGSHPAPAAELSPSAAPAALTRLVVLLFDDRHLAPDQVPAVREAARHLLDQPLPPTDQLSVVSFTGVNSGFTRDRERLLAALNKITAHPGFLHAKEDCPDIDYYAADQIVNKHDGRQLQIAVQKTKNCASIQDAGPSGPVDPEGGMGAAPDFYQRTAMGAAIHALAMGDEDSRESLIFLGAVVRALSRMQGQRSIILISPGFLSLSAEAMAVKSRIIDIAAGSNVVVNAVDARGLYAGNVDASSGGNQATVAMVTGQAVRDRLEGMEQGENAIAELAYGTGGAFFHANNDLTHGLTGLFAPPEYLYLLEISLNGVKQNGTYHRLQVKVARPDVEVQARKGYFAPKAAKK